MARSAKSKGTSRSKTTAKKARTGSGEPAVKVKRAKTKATGKLKTLVKHGNSLALVIDKTVLTQLNLDATTPLRVSVVGSGLRVERADVGLGPERTKEILGKLREDPTFVEMMQKLAE